MNSGLEKLVKFHAGKWVALKPGTSVVVAGGNNAKKVYEKGQKKGIKTPTLFKVPIKLIPYIG